MLTAVAYIVCTVAALKNLPAAYVDVTCSAAPRFVGSWHPPTVPGAVTFPQAPHGARAWSEIPQNT